VTRTIAHSTPYAWPYDGRLDAERLCLLVVTPAEGGVVADPEQVSAWERVRELVPQVQSAGGVVLEVRTTPPCRPGPGQRPPAPAESAPRPDFGTQPPILAAGIDGFYGSGLDTVLRRQGLDQLLLCGGWLETSVHSTMRSANDQGYECLLVLDACAPYDSALVAAARSQIEMSGGIFGAVGLTGDVLAALSTLATDLLAPTHERTAS
jgi:nicotinamidase-related amidase